MIQLSAEPEGVGTEDSKLALFSERAWLVVFFGIFYKCN